VRLLLDTHVVLWWVLNDPRLPQRAYDILEDEGSDLYLSAASVVEMATKIAIGKLTLRAPLPNVLSDLASRGRVIELPVTNEQACRIVSLPLHHRDPFDRLLVAVALNEGLTLLTDDADIRAYPVPTVW
jgi:PIN domain nuclease of toxin-antitoxin system